MRVAHGYTAMVRRNRFATAMTLALCLVASNSRLAFGDDTATDIVAASPLTDQAPLNQQIDQLLQPTVPQVASPSAPDGILLRRLSLDLRGVVPTREELDEFITDESIDRWATWVDRFLQDPLCDQHLMHFLDRTLMLRRKHTHVNRDEWSQYLLERISAGTPLDSLTRELLFTPWWNQDERPSQRFYLDRGGEPHLIARDLGRIFLGRDLQCAQCHDHPLVEDYRQIDYHGLLAFVSAGSLVQVSYKDAEQKDKKVQLYVEKAAGDAAFESVFEKGTKLRSGPRLSGQVESFDTYDRPDSRYVSEAPEGALAGAPLPPKVSRRQQLAERLANRDDETLVANWANRLWALVFGRGLVDPVDMMGPDNPPSHPQLLDLLTDGLRQSDMKIKPFLRQLVLTEAYQRGDADQWMSTEQWMNLVETNDASVAELGKISAELESLQAEVESLVAAERVAQAAYDSAKEEWLKAQAERTVAREKLDQAEAEMLKAKKAHDDANKELNAATKKLADNQTRQKLLQESAEKLRQAMSLADGDDAELAKAIELAQKRAEEANANNDALQKAVTAATAKVESAKPPLDKSIADIDKLVAELNPIQLAVRNADETHVTARRSWSHARSDLVAARRKVFRLERWVTWIAKKDEARKLVKSMDALQNQLIASRETEATMLASSENVKTSVADALKQVEIAEQAEATAMDVVKQQEQQIQTLRQAVTSLENASNLVSERDTLLAAKASLKNDIEGKVTELGELQAGVTRAQDEVAAKQSALQTQQTRLQSELASLTRQRDHSTSLQQQLDQAKSQLESVQGSIESDKRLIRRDATRQLAATELSPLTPEQLCWSTLRITGVLDSQIRSSAAELQKNSPLPEDADAETSAARDREATRNAIQKLRGHLDRYVSLYASGADKTQDDFFASADQALYVANGGSVFNWSAPSNNNPTQVAASKEDPAEVAKVLYWSYLCRQPSAEEITLVTDQLANAGDARTAVIQEMAWSLLASAEFRFVR